MTKRHSKYKRFNKIFLLTSSLFVLSAFFFNILIDRYDILGVPKIPGFNQSKLYKDHQIRLFKAVDITKIKPRTILMGSSRAELGLNPYHPALLEILPAYNLGMNRANMSEIKSYFFHALSNQPKLKRVIIGLDFFSFSGSLNNAPDFTEERLNIDRLSFRDFLKVNLILPFNDIKSIVNSSRSIKKPLEPYGLNGMRNTDFILDLKRKRKQNNTEFFQSSLIGYFLGDDFYRNYTLSQEKLNDLRAIIETCKNQDIQLILFISPSYATQWEAIRDTGNWSKFEELKREIAKMISYWDFSGYNSITSEFFREDMQYYLDSSHYSKKTGDLVLNRILNHHIDTVPSDFGVLVNNNNVELHLGKIRNDRERWAKDNLRMVKLIAELELCTRNRKLGVKYTGHLRQKCIKSK
jgi:hypothetical protein